MYIIFIVDQNGRVENPIVQKSTDPIFEAPALAAVKQVEVRTRQAQRQAGALPHARTDHLPQRVTERDNSLCLLSLILLTLHSSVVRAARDRVSELSARRRAERSGTIPAFQRHFAESYIAETEIEPRVTADEREQMQKVLELIAADKMDEAANLLEKHGGEAASAVFDFTLANIYFQQEQLDQAAAAYEKAVEKFPKFRRAWSNLGLIRVRQGDFAKALRAADAGDRAGRRRRDHLRPARLRLCRTSTTSSPPSPPTAWRFCSIRRRWTGRWASPAASSSKVATPTPSRSAVS